MIRVEFDSQCKLSAQDLPEIAGVYSIWFSKECSILGENHTCLYVGQSVNIKQRLTTGHTAVQRVRQSQLKNGAFDNCVVYVEIEEVSKDRLDEVEADLISKAKPAWNKTTGSTKTKDNIEKQRAYFEDLFENLRHIALAIDIISPILLNYEQYFVNTDGYEFCYFIKFFDELNRYLAPFKYGTTDLAELAKTEHINFNRFVNNNEKKNTLRGSYRFPLSTPEYTYGIDWDD